MASLHRVSCINKSNRTSAHERIHYIGGINGDGTKWKLSQVNAISKIEDGTYEFYVVVDAQRVKIIVSVSRYGNKYLKTVSDGEHPNNLLSLPECP